MSIFSRFFLLVLCFSSSIVYGQVYQYTTTIGTGALQIEVLGSNPCFNGATLQYGYIEFRVLNTVDGLPAKLNTIVGNNGAGPNFFIGATIPVGSSFIFFGPNSGVPGGSAFTPNLPIGSYDFYIEDDAGTEFISSFSPTISAVDLTQLSDIIINEDLVQNNTDCSPPLDGQVVASLSGGSLDLVGGTPSPAEQVSTESSFTYTWSSNNGLAGLPLTGSWDGTTPLDLASMLALPGLPGGTYTLSVEDDFSVCLESRQFTISDPTPAVQNVLAPFVQNICTGDNITVQLDNSEAGVSYQILRNGSTPPLFSFPGGASPLIMTFSSAAFNTTDFIVVRAVDGFCSPTTMNNTVSIVKNPIPTISGVVVGSVCAGSTSTNLNYTSTTGSPNQYSIDFDAIAEGQGFVDVVNLPFPASPITITIPASASAAIYNATFTVRNSSTGCPSTGIPITIPILANPTITLGANPSVCSGTLTANLPYTATTGSPNQYSIDFNLAAEAQGFVDVVNVALPASPIVITVPGAAVANTYNATLTVRNTGSTCSSSSQPITVTINPNPTITLGANPTVCSGTTTANLGYSATTGSPNQYSINFNAAAEAQGFVDVVNAALPATPVVIAVPGAAAAGIYNATLTVRNNLTGCVSPSQNITVTIVASPTITLGANPSVCIGSATANLGYTGTTGSPNQYSIDFDAAAQAQGFVDVSNVALPASPIGITIPGAAVAGIYNGTLTVRNTVTGCISTSQPITVTINPTPTITLGANPSVCTGATTAGLGYSATTGSPNQYSIDFNAAAQAQGFVDVVNAALPATPISITVPVAAAPGVYNATITVRNSTTGCVSASSPISVTIVARPTITLNANPSVCIGSTTANLGYSAITGGPNQYSINFNAAAEAQGFIDVVNAVLPGSPIVITVPGAAGAGTYNATITVLNTTTGCVSASQNISVTIIASPTITLGPNPSVCIGSATANLGYTGTTGSPNQYSIDFDAAAQAQGFVDILNVVLPGSPIVITIPGAAVAGIYNGTLTVRNTVTGCISTSQPITVTINTTPTITLGANPSVCTGATTAGLGYSASTGSPNQYSIDFNAAAQAQGFVDVVNAALPATPISITVPGAAAAGVYNATITVRNSTTGCVSASSPITVTIVASPTITLNANPSVCIGSTTANLGYSATTGSPNQYSINFNAAAEAQGFIDVVNAVLPASPIVIAVPAASVAGTYNATITVLNTTTGCVSASQNISVTIVASPTITLGPNPSVCIGSATANLGYTGTTGSPNQYSIDFDAAAQVQGFVDMSNVALPASPIGITIPGAAVAGIYNGTLTVRNTVTGCIGASQPITVTINPTPTITLGANPSVCTGATTTGLGYSATTGSPNQYSIDFNAAAQAQGFVDVVNAALPATPISITVPGAAAAGVYNATITVRNSTTGCVSTSSPISVTIVARPTITLNANPSVCIGSATANLGYSAITGGPNQYSINFNAASEAQGFIDVVNAVLPASPIVITVPGAAVAGTYNATLTVLNTTTGCVSASQNISVTIVASPTIALGANPSVCIGSATANLGYTGTTGSPNQYSIDFDAAAQAQGFVDVSNVALPASPIGITIPGAAVAGIYNGTLTVRNTITGCISTSQPITVTISATPTITLGANPSVCLGSTTADLGYSATTGSPNQYSIDFNGAAEAQGFVDVVNAALPATTISITIPGSAVEGTYNATITVRNGVSCSSAAQPISVTISPVSSIAGIVVGSVCVGTTSTNLNYTSTTGAPNQYSIDFDAIAEAQGFVDVVNSPFPASPVPIAIPALAAANNYNANFTVTNSLNGCPSTSIPITVTVLPNPTIALGPNPSVCIGATTADLTYTATGSPNQYSINFDLAAEAQGFVDVVNAALPASPIAIAIPGAAGAGTYNATIIVRSTSSTCASAPQPISVTINTSPTITLDANPSVCSGSAIANLGYSATTGSPTQYSIDFNAAAEAQGFVDVSNVSLPATPIGISIPGTAIAGTYNGTLTVRNAITGCSSASQAINITITPSPTATITGTTAICNGSSTNITVNFTGTGPWSFEYSDGTTTSPVIPSFFNSITFSVSPTATTTYTLVSVDDNTVCTGTFSGSAVVTVNQSPQTNLPVGVSLNPICSGGTTDVTVSNSQAGVSYQLRNNAGNAPVGGAVAGTGGTISLSTGALIADQTFNVLATATGCTPVQLTNLANVTVSGTINPSLSVSALANPICEGTSTVIQVANSENGVLYQLRDDSNNNPVGAAVAGNGLTLDLPTGNLTATTAFNVLASNGSCSIELTDIETVNVNINPDPALAVAVTLDPICVGGSSAVTVASSEVGVTYQLRTEPGNVNVGAAVVGTNGLISLPTGILNATATFNVLATSGVCPAVELTTQATVNVSGTIDASLLVTAANGSICSGTSTNIQVANSENGISYQLRNDADNTPIGAPIVGNGSNIDLSTGNLTTSTIFNVLASNGTCSIQLTDTAAVAVDITPDASLAVAATLNPLCIGGTSAITVTLSQSDVSYQLRNDADDTDIGLPVIGTGGTISLSTEVLNATTTFNVFASSGVCASVELTQVVTVTVAGSINAALNVTSSASPICEGTSTFIRVELSEAGVNYQLRNDANDNNVGGVIAGNGATINLPTGNLTATTTFNVVADNGTCSIELTDKETITVNPGPDITLAVAPASGLICSGTSTNIVVTSSQVGVSYQLRNGTTAVGLAVTGTGNNITLSTGNLTVNTTFNVFATLGSCSAQLTATASVAIRPIGDPACGPGGPGGSDCANFSAIIPTIVTQPSCNDRDAGEVSFAISRSDGTPTTFRVIWTYNGTDQTKFTASTVSFDDLNSGLYKYTIIDEGNGKSCGPVDFFLDLKTQVEILNKEVLANVSCFGGTDGNVKLTVDGTTTGEYWYKYVVDGQESVAQTFTPGAPLPGGLPADDDDFIIIKVDETFAFACPDTVMVKIKNAYPKIDFSVVSTEVSTCNGTDGAIQVSGIIGGNTTTSGLQIRLMKEVPFTTDPSGYSVIADFENVNAGAKEYTGLAQGNYIVNVKDQGDCMQGKPIAIQAPGQVPLSAVNTLATDASCVNEGASGSIQVTINQPGIYQVAVSQDQANVPADDQFVAYNSPSLPNVTFNNLIRGRYFLYIKSSTTLCPTRSDVIAIGGVYAISDFDIFSNCENVNITLNNITGQQDAPFVIRVFNNNDKFFKIDSLTASSIPLSNSVSFNYAAPLQHSFLIEQGTYRFVMIQNQTTGAGTCTLVSDTVVYDIRQQVGIVLGQVKPSFPDPKRTGSIEIENINGGTRFVSGTNELYYEVSLSTADDDIVVFDWAPAKLNPQNKFAVLFDYLSPGVYRIKVRDASGCIRTQDVEIALDPSVFVPNIFTPNEDDVNDEFEIMNLPLDGKHKLIISNRWGNQVFSSNDYREGNFWNAEGTSDGIYFYRLKIEGGETLTGWVEILRGNKP